MSEWKLNGAITRKFTLIIVSTLIIARSNHSN